MNHNYLNDKTIDANNENILSENSDKKKKHIKLDCNRVYEKFLHYKILFENIHKETHENKEGLILYYSRLNQYNLAVHVSIIFLSSVSTFVQSFIPEEQQNDTIKLLLLLITSYSGFILAFCKFYKLEEKKENSNNLRDRYADLEMKINFYLDYIRPWEKYTHYSDDHSFNKNKYSEWCNLIDKIETEYMNIIEYKKELNSIYEKIIDTHVNRIYIKRYLTKQRNKQKKHDMKNMVQEQKEQSKIGLKMHNQSKQVYLKSMFKKISICDKIKYLFCNIIPNPVFNKYYEYNEKMKEEKNNKNKSKHSNNESNTTETKQKNVKNDNDKDSKNTQKNTNTTNEHSNINDTTKLPENTIVNLKKKEDEKEKKSLTKKEKNIFKLDSIIVEP